MPAPEAVKLLEQKRIRLGLSRSLLCRFLKIPEPTYYRWLAGVHNPSLYYSEKIQKLLKIIEEIEKEASK